MAKVERSPISILGIDDEWLRENRGVLEMQKDMKPWKALCQTVLRLAKSHRDLMAQKCRPDIDFAQKMFTNIPEPLLLSIDQMARDYCASEEQEIELAKEHGKELIEAVKARRNTLIAEGFQPSAPREYKVDKEKWKDFKRKAQTRIDHINKQARDWQPIAWAWEELNREGGMDQWLREALEDPKKKRLRLAEEQARQTADLIKAQAAWLEFVRCFAGGRALGRHPVFRHRVLKLNSFEMPPARLLVTDVISQSQQQAEREMAGGARKSKTKMQPAVSLPVNTFDLEVDEKGGLILHRLKRGTFDPQHGVPTDPPIFWNVSRNPGTRSTKWVRTGESERMPGKIVGSLDLEDMKLELGQAWAPKAALSGVGTGIGGRFGMIKGYPEEALMPYLPYYSPWLFETTERKCVLMVEAIEDEQAVICLLQIVYIHVDENYDPPDLSTWTEASGQ